MSSTKYKRDLRWPVAIATTVTGVTLALLTRWLNGDNWYEFLAVAGYSVAWALITFAVLYLLSKAFETWEWGREDHDLTKMYDDGKQ